MAHYFFDSSALVKYYVRETGTQMTAAGLGPLTLISADLELNQAAQAEGLLTDDPNQHP